MTLEVQKVIYTVKRPKSTLSDAALFQKESLSLNYLAFNHVFKIGTCISHFSKDFRPVLAMLVGQKGENV